MKDVILIQNFVTLSALGSLIFVGVETNPLFITQKMNATEGTGNLITTKGRLKQKFALLTDNYLLLAEGKKEEIQGKLLIKFGQTKNEIQKIISTL